MTLAGSVWHKPGAAGGPGRPSLMDTVLPPPGFWGDRGRLMEVVAGWVCSQGPKAP